MTPKRLLILSFYYTPDLSACSFRTESLVKSLLETYPDIEIDLVTTFPSRYISYNPDCAGDENNARLKIHRVELPFFYNGFGLLSEFFSFLYFAKKVIKHTQRKEYDIIYATSAKLATATLARFLANNKSSKLYLDIRDLFVDNIKDMFSKTFCYLSLPFLKKLELYSFRGADRINIVSDAFRPYVGKYVSGENLRSFTNGIDEKFTLLPNRENKTNTLNIVYAGNVGRAQSLEKIIPNLAEYPGLNIKITIVGDGRNATLLVSKLAERNIKNVNINIPVSRDELIKFYQQADVLFLHLDDYDCLTRVIPSKVFEYAATGLPMLCGVNGYTKEFIESNIPNARTFTPNNVKDCVDNLNTLSLNIVQRDEFCYQYSRRKIMKSMSKDIYEVLHG